MNLELPILAPSLLAADFSNLGEQIETCTEAGITWLHCDIMDGHFVPNISYGPGTVQAFRNSAPDAFLDVHLMIENPDSYIESFVNAGADLISVHYEACPHLHRTIQNIASYECMTGVVVNPATPVSLLKPILSMVDLVLIMSVNPGFGGQSFIESSYEKIHELNAIRAEGNHSFLIEIDGGVGLNNIQKLANAGVDILVAGSSVFKKGDITESIQELTKKAKIGKGSIV